MAFSERQRYMSFPSARAILKERQRVCILLRGYARSPNHSERMLHRRAHGHAEETYLMQDFNGDVPTFQWGSLFHFELILANITGDPVRPELPES